MFISRLVRGGLAESTGLLGVNDEILEVNGIDVAGKSLDQVNTWSNLPGDLASTSFNMTPYWFLGCCVLCPALYQTFSLHGCYKTLLNQLLRIHNIYQSSK